MKCWSNEHANQPHQVIPLEEAELEILRNAASMNTDAIMDFQTSEKSLFDQLSKIGEMSNSALQKTDEIVSYQVNVLSEKSIDTLKRYENDMTRLFHDKYLDIKKFQESLDLINMASADVVKRMQDLILMVPNNKVPLSADTTLIPLNQLPHEKKPARMKVISSQLVRELGLGDQVALCTPVVNIATGEIFFNSYRDNRIHVFDLEFRLKYSFNFETGTAESDVSS
ncbi:uncharacterized protein LOC142338613 isoform X2 [Convolutriloba macropyga]|uniref:uncharacterized protein LOC142338613 isoform X2 n=1 Tax=Convolutriloba macropyga TaxID=536237 RepID=UPI003F522C13